jgi:hypothetical protein
MSKVRDPVSGKKQPIRVSNGSIQLFPETNYKFIFKAETHRGFPAPEKRMDNNDKDINT